MLDAVLLELRAGDGGHGRVSFRREKYVPKGGPDGGDGGRGGDIIVKASAELNTLDTYMGRTNFKAESGQMGGKQKRIGRDGEDLVLEVPVGTTIWLLAENTASYRGRRRAEQPEGSRQYLEKKAKYYLEAEGQGMPPREPDEPQPITDSIQIPNSLKNTSVKDLEKLELVTLDEAGQSVLICKGGVGGRGNVAFKSPSNTTPLEAEYGGVGEHKIVIFEQKLLANIGLVGYPNAGKSTLLSVITKARPKIADYPFTTLHPHLGILDVSDQPGDRQTLVVADIPGLIEGASQGKGLGYTFLRHVENSQVLAYVLSLDETVLFDETTSSKDKAVALLDQYNQLKTELAEYDPSMIEKPHFIVVNKLDLYDEELQEAITQVFADHKLKIDFISGFTHQGLDTFKERALSLID